MSENAPINRFLPHDRRRSATWPSSFSIDDLDRILAFNDPEVDSNDPKVDSIENLLGYLDAAAVLAAFDPFRLRPADDEDASSSESLLDRLLPRCEPITQGPGRGLWTLSLPDRRDGLRRLGSRKVMRQALRANVRMDIPIQRMFERILGERAIPLGTASREELAALFTVLDWVDGILGGLPGRSEIGRALARVDLLAPMRRLAGKDFVGRGRELDQLREYVDGSEPPVPLFVSGPGGVGKSTLLAKFVLETAELHNRPVVYLDIDRPTIRPDQPATLLLDAVTQLRSQLDVDPSRVDGLVSEITYSVGRGDPARYFESFAPHSENLEQFQTVFAPALDSVVLVVVDTFEEVQFLGPDVVWSLLDFLFEFFRSLPTLRLVLAGRALPDEYVSRAFPEVPRRELDLHPASATALEQVPLPYRPIDLGVLDEEPARELLRRSIARASIAALRPGEADAIIGVVGRNPMCLKLAARLLRDEGVDALRATRSQFLTLLKAEKIQALLYGRILRHVHADDVRAVAYPGLVVRRITPDVIRDVLAVPCQLEITPARNEYAIFDDLRKEAALVEVDFDGSLRHRVDVRRAMLEDLTDHVSRDVVEWIDRRAVEFYASRPDPVSRAEEIYHRLRRREPVEALDARWRPEAATHLRNAGEELPAQQRLWLANKLGITLDESVRRTANQEAWEDQAARSVERYLQTGSPQLALDILHERTTRLPRSKLYFLEAEANRFLGRPQQALQVARDGVESASTAGAIDMALELLLKMVVIEEGRGELRSAAELLEEARGVAAHSSDEVLRFRVTVTELRLHRRLRPDATDERDKLRSEALIALKDEVRRALRAQPVLLQEAAAELGENDPSITAAAVETLGLPVATDAQAHALGHAIATLNETQPSDVALNRTFVEGAHRFEETHFDADVIRGWAVRSVTSKDTRNLGFTLSTTEPGAEVLREFGDYFRESVADNLQGPTEPGNL